MVIIGALVSSPMECKTSFVGCVEFVCNTLKYQFDKQRNAREIRYIVIVCIISGTVASICISFFFFSYPLLPPGVGVLGPSAELFSTLCQLVHSEIALNLQIL
jgi:hypothetical protein